MRFQSAKHNRPENIISSLIQIFFLILALGLIVWHTVQWHINGTHQTMLTWIGADKVYLLILYNLALMLISGSLLGILMGKITGLFSFWLTKK